MYPARYTVPPSTTEGHGTVADDETSSGSVIQGEQKDENPKKVKKTSAKSIRDSAHSSLLHTLRPRPSTDIDQLLAAPSPPLPPEPPRSNEAHVENDELIQTSATNPLVATGVQKKEDDANPAITAVSSGDEEDEDSDSWETRASSR